MPILKTTVELTTETTVYHFCDFRAHRFPPIPESLSSALLEWNWMTEHQLQVTRIYGWTTVAILIAFLISTVGVQLFYKFMSLFKGLYEVSQCQDIPNQCLPLVFEKETNLKLNAETDK